LGRFLSAAESSRCRPTFVFGPTSDHDARKGLVGIWMTSRRWIVAAAHRRRPAPPEPHWRVYIPKPKPACAGGPSEAASLPTQAIARAP